jgi:hypothetical protein
MGVYLRVLSRQLCVLEAKAKAKARTKTKATVRLTRQRFN